MNNRSTGTTDKKKRIYLFHEGRKEDKAILGGKGANLCEVCTDPSLCEPSVIAIQHQTRLAHIGR